MRTRTKIRKNSSLFRPSFRYLRLSLRRGRDLNVLQLISYLLDTTMNWLTKRRKNEPRNSKSKIIGEASVSTRGRRRGLHFRGHAQHERTNAILLRLTPIKLRLIPIHASHVRTRPQLTDPIGLNRSFSRKTNSTY
jgi:hypothetical protein